MKETINIRPVRKEDMEQIAAIYAYYVENTAISFELVAPSVDEMLSRMETIVSGYPYLVAENIEGKICGYAYASKFHPRAALSHCVESSVYIDRHTRHSGIGTLLMEALEEGCRLRGFLNIYASIATTPTYDSYLPTGSLAFHLGRGYSVVGTFERCGYKFDHWYDLTWVGRYL